MAKIKKTTQPKKTVRKTVKKIAAVKTVVKPNINQLPEKLQKLNLLPIAIFLVAVFVLVALFIFLRKTLVVATVNGQPLTRLAVVKTLEKQGAKQVVDSLISQTLLVQKAKQEKITASNDEIQAEITKIEAQLQNQGSDLPTVLATKGMTQQDLEEQIKLRLLWEKLLAGKTSVSDKEVNKYITQNRDSYPEDMKEAELKKTVREQLENQKLSTAAQDLLAKLKEEASIKYYINYWFLVYLPLHLIKCGVVYGAQKAHNLLDWVRLPAPQLKSYG